MGPYGFGATARVCPSLKIIFMRLVQKSWGPMRQLMEIRSLLLGSGVLQALAPGWGGATTGSVPAFSSSRFLYETVGSCFLMRGMPCTAAAYQLAQHARARAEMVQMVAGDSGGAEVLPVSTAADVEQLLGMAIGDVVAMPARALQVMVVRCRESMTCGHGGASHHTMLLTVQAWLDHHASSYAHDLETAALAALRRGLRSQREQLLPSEG